MATSVLKHSIQSILKEVDAIPRKNQSPFSREGFRPFRCHTFKYSTLVPFPIDQRVDKCGCVTTESVEKTTLTSGNVAPACATENVIYHGDASPGLDETPFRSSFEGVSRGLDLTPYKSACSRPTRPTCVGLLPQQTDRSVKAPDSSIIKENRNPCFYSTSISNGISSEDDTIACRGESTSHRPNIASKRSASPSGTDDTSFEQSEDCKRQRRMRTTFNTEQLASMEEMFAVTHYPNFEIRKQLSEATDLEEERIQIWFQNRRAKWRKYEKLGNFGGLEHLRETEVVPAPMSTPLAQMSVLPVPSACQSYLILDQALPPHFDACLTNPFDFGS
ncbi:ALX homeobox protein 1-like [Anneissia japonica]|uniref:ALX homeobox protein 1-like n=1 Tax=Anneissia japonica TaxID=1529436 RepID=UPI0014254C4C|nr:ALX homeobox protein 1-like [Anneissia japonica]